MRGDSVEILVDAGDGAVQRFEIAATRNGRRVEVSTGRGVVEVTEVTRGGTPVRSGRFMSSRVVAVVEHPSTESGAVEETTRRRLGQVRDADTAMVEPSRRSVARRRQTASEVVADGS